jgi:hypothetical protein
MKWGFVLVTLYMGPIGPLLIFQALFMRKMMGGTYTENVRRSFLPELISMNCDGETLAPAARFKADTVNVGPGQRYDVIWTALKPGKWMIHCHIGHRTTNNNTEQEGGGGLMMHIEVE